MTDADIIEISRQKLGKTRERFLLRLRAWRDVQGWRQPLDAVEAHMRRVAGDYFRSQAVKP